MTSFGPSPPDDDGVDAAGDGLDDLPERIIVVREPVDDDHDDEHEQAGVPTIDIDAPSDPDELQAELDALAADIAAAPIDLDEVDLRSVGRAEPPTIDLDADSLDRSVDTDIDADADVESLGHLAPSTVDPEDDDESFGHLAPGDDEGADDAESLDRTADTEGDPGAEWASDTASLGHAAPANVDPHDDDESFGHLEAADDPEEDLGPFRGRAGERRAELDALVAQVAASQEPDDRRGEWDEPWPGRDETGPGTLRPKVPEPVLAARTNASPSVARRTVSRMRALLGLVVVVLLAGVALAGAIGAAVLLVVFALSRAFGSG